MKLYEISDKGELIELDKLNFNDDDVYLVDDNEKNTIYIWVGLQVPQYKKDITAAYARKMDKERGSSLKILIMRENREYGSFLIMMNDLKKGLIPGETSERRVELILEDSSIEDFDEVIEEKIEIDQESRIQGWLGQLIRYRSTKTEEEVIKNEEHEKLASDEVNTEPELNLSHEIREAAYFLSLDRYTYNELCWLLAEKILKITLGMPSLEQIRQKAEQVFSSSSTYDELCWLNAEMEILLNKGYLEKEKIGFF